MINRHKKEIWLVDIINAWKKYEITFKRILIIVYNIIEDLVFSFI